jgi:hypothetical protein
VTDQPQFQPGKARPGGGIPPQPVPQPAPIPEAVDPWVTESETVRATRDDLLTQPNWEAQPSWGSAPTAYVDPPYGVAVPSYDQPPRPPRRTGLIVGIVVLVLLAGAAAVYFALGGSPKKTDTATGGRSSAPAGAGPTVTTSASATSGTGPTKPSPSASPRSAAACAIGTWLLTAETLKEDSSVFGVGSGTITLTAQHPNESRTFQADGTGVLDVANTYTGTASDGTPVSVAFTGKGSFDYTYDGKTVTYTNVQMPGTIDVYVNGTKESSTQHDPLYINGSDPMSCVNDTLIQHGDTYSRTYTRKAL